MGRYFYVDDQEGNDLANGLSMDCAWKSLAAVNRMVFGAGDHICFKRGGKWQGMLSPSGSGRKFDKIVLEAYGEGECPEIDGMGAYAAVLLEGVSNWLVKDLKVKNTANERAVRQGICVMGSPLGVTSGIEIQECEICGVMGENRRARDVYQSMYWNGGIYVSFPGRSDERNHLHDIIISNNYIHDVYTSGIRINQQEDFLNDIHHTHIVVRGNRIERTGSDGIIVANCISPLITHNICLHAGALGSLEDTQLIAGIWVCATSNALIERNEVGYTRLFENDGTAFDTDWGTAGDTIFQYNYTHDNEGGFWLDCMKLNHNKDCGKTILRYNISVRDGRGLAVYDQGMPVYWYGNAFYYEKPAEICLFDEGENFLFESNVFCMEQEPIRGWQACKYKNNVSRHTNCEEEASYTSWKALLKQVAEGVKEEHKKSSKKELDMLLGQITEGLCHLVKTKGQESLL